MVVLILRSLLSLPGQYIYSPDTVHIVVNGSSEMCMEKANGIFCTLVIFQSKNQLLLNNFFTPNREIVSNATKKPKKLVLAAARSIRNSLYDDDSDAQIIKKKRRMGSNMTEDEFMKWVSY